MTARHARSLAPLRERIAYRALYNAGRLALWLLVALVVGVIVGRRLRSMDD